MRKKWKRIATLAIILVSFISLVGCNGKTEEPKEQEGVVIEEDFVPLTDIKEGRPDIYVIVKSMTSSYWTVVLAGAKQAGIDQECNIYAAGSTLETEWELQEAYIDLAVKSGADAIVLGPDNSEMLSPKVEELHKKGVPTIIVDTMVNTKEYDVCYMTDNLMAGEQAAKEMIRMLKELGHTDTEKVTVAIELGARASQTINERLAGFCQYWTKYAPDAWSIIDEIKCNDGDEELAVTLSEDFFDEYPNVDGVFGTDNASTMGFSSALASKNKDRVVLVGFDYSPEVAEIINSKKYNVSVMLQRQYDMGYKGVGTALSIINNRPGRLKFVDTGVVVLNGNTINTDEVQAILKNNRGN